MVHSMSSSRFFFLAYSIFECSENIFLVLCMGDNSLYLLDTTPRVPVTDRYMNLLRLD